MARSRCRLKPPNVEHISLALSKKGIPYVTYKSKDDVSINYVKMYNGSSWTELEGISEHYQYRTSLAFDNNNTLYAAFQRYPTDRGRKLLVKKFNGTTTWEAVGKNDGVVASGNNYNSISLVVDKKCTLYIAYTDGFRGDRAIVKKFDSTSTTWVSGTGDTSSGISSGDRAEHLSLAFDNNNTAYIAYREHYNKAAVLVKKLVNTTWQDLQVQSPMNTDFESLAIDNNNTVYVAYKIAHYGKPTVKKFNGTTWDGVGSASGEVDSGLGGLSIITYRDILYIAYSNNDKKAVVKKFNGTTWDGVGSASGVVSSGKVDFISLKVDDIGVLYLAYQDTDNGNKAVVMKYDIAK